MAAARLEERWNHTAALLALFANCHRDPARHRAFTAADFHPLRGTPASAPPTADLSVLKTVFVDRHLPEHPL
ncbi:MAG: hypothetical protein H0X38_05180 [Planctomycetes bacterium]|nr:hypothetical protein [Planctomycetota bacterium]